MDDASYCATTLHKSSCASADPSDTETIAARDDAISDLSRMKERLKGMLTHYEGTLKCATAWVCPPFLEDDLFLDNVSLKSGCVKCYVTEVKPGFNEFALKNVLGDFNEQRTLGETLLHHIQWPQKEIEFIDEIPGAPPRATTIAPQPVTLSLLQQLSRADASTCDQPARLWGVHAMSSSAQRSQWQGLQLLMTHHQFRCRPLKQRGETLLQHMLSRPTWWNRLLSSRMLRNHLLSSL